jgi:two-component system NtrC family sensor kinase
VENKHNSENQKINQSLTVHLDDSIIEFLKQREVDISHLKINPQESSQLIFLKKKDRLWIQFPDGQFCDFAFYLKNIIYFLSHYGLQAGPVKTPEDTFLNFNRSVETFQKKIYSSVSLNPNDNFKDLWDEIIKKTNLISNESHSLRSLVEKILEVPFLQKFESSIIYFHLKGQTKAEMIGTRWRSENVNNFMEVKDFNIFFNSIKKSKIKTFNSEDFQKIKLPFNGSFLAKEIISKKFSLIAIVSRHDFLDYSDEEISLFETCIDLLQPHFDRLIDQEFSDQKISDLRICLKDFPLPLRVKDTQTGTMFSNDLYRNDLQDKDIFFNKKILDPFSLDLYDSDELRHYAFDLFHFQRISLLGELLNTLRHELSNPLFGLKLGSQIFTSLDINEDDRLIMIEIEKNVNRCQQIIENFSNLYQIQTEKKLNGLQKMIDESLMLSKSETRQVLKHVYYYDDSEKLQLNLPQIFVVQILFNLIVNAAQAMRDQIVRPEIWINVKKENAFATIEVKDNGEGIPDEKVSQLFKPFFTTKSQGTGLGLVLSRNLAIKMDGNLEYIKDMTGGATFKLSLPIK